jgi:DNA polymerase-3 subunit gamma/tau
VFNNYFGADIFEIKFEESGLWFLAKAANGSMRDALSLTDQAISYCPSELKKNRYM